MGAPQLGHFNDATPDGAITGPDEPVEADLAAFNDVGFPHLVQNAEPSAIWAPQF